MPALAPTPLPPLPPFDIDHHLPPPNARPEGYAFDSACLHDGFSPGEYIQSCLDATGRNPAAGDEGTLAGVWPHARDETVQERLANEFCPSTSDRDSFPSLPREFDEESPTTLHGATPATSSSASHIYHGHSAPASDPPNTAPPNIPSAPDAEDPQWKLSLDTYTWIFAVMYPKRRPNKKEPTPSGPCRLCSSVSRRPGILQQHLTVLHRQRLARKVLAGHQYNGVLALAFVVAQLESYPGDEYEADITSSECARFKDLIARQPLGQDCLDPREFPLLFQKLTEFSARDGWMGVKCKYCGMLATRSVALVEHANVCAGAKRASQADETIVDRPPVRLTTSGRAARPSRTGR